MTVRSKRMKIKNEYDLTDQNEFSTLKVFSVLRDVSKICMMPHNHRPYERFSSIAFRAKSQQSTQGALYCKLKAPL